MSLSESPDHSPEREPPQTVGEAIAAIEAALAPYPRIWQTQFAGDHWDDLRRNKGRSLSDIHPSDGFFRADVPFRLFLAQCIVNQACDNFIQEASIGRVCFLPDDTSSARSRSRMVDMRPATPQDIAEIWAAVQFLLAFVQIDLGVPVVIQRDTGMPFVSSPGHPG